MLEIIKLTAALIWLFIKFMGHIPLFIYWALVILGCCLWDGCVDWWLLIKQVFKETWEKRRDFK